MYYFWKCRNVLYWGGGTIFYTLGVGELGKVLYLSMIGLGWSSNNYHSYSMKSVYGYLCKLWTDLHNLKTKMYICK